MCRGSYLLGLGHLWCPERCGGIWGLRVQPHLCLTVPILCLRDLPPVCPDQCVSEASSVQHLIATATMGPTKSCPRHGFPPHLPCFSEGASPSGPLPGSLLTLYLHLKWTFPARNFSTSLGTLSRMVLLQPSVGKCHLKIFPIHCRLILKYNII